MRMSRLKRVLLAIEILCLGSGAVCIANQRQVSQNDIVRDSSERAVSGSGFNSQKGIESSSQVSQNEVILPSLKSGVFIAPKLVSEDLSKICESDFLSIVGKDILYNEENHGLYEEVNWRICTPAWSPNGKHIAFNATPSQSGWLQCEGGSGIWIADVAGLDRAPKVSLLVKAPNRMNSPGYPFWISPDEIGWCDDFTDDHNNHFLSFYHSSILKPHVETLGTRRFRICDWIFCLPLCPEQVRMVITDMPRYTEHQSGVNIDTSAHNKETDSQPSKSCGSVVRFSVMPDDLYWDSKERCIAFSAHRDEADSQLIMNEFLAKGRLRSDGSVLVDEELPEFIRVDDRLRSKFPQKAAIWIYDPWNEKAKQVCIPTDSMRSSEISEQSQVSFCGLPTSAEESFLIQCGDNDWSVSGLWMREGRNLSFDNYRLITKDDELRFPRMSPKGDAIAWISTGTSGMSSQEKDAVNFADRGVHLWVMKISKDGKRTVRRLSEKSLGFAEQCPFCWSPDGKSIAYTDGKKIYIVDI